MARKTVEIARLKEEANRILRHPFVSVNFKRGAIELLEVMLMDADAYKGFGWINADGSLVSPEVAKKIVPDDEDNYYRRRYY